MARKSFTFELKGIKDVQKRIDSLTEKMEVDLDKLVEGAANDMNDDAISNIQSNGAQDLGAGGGLVSHQYVQPAGERKYEVGNSAPHAPFIEWGTGRQVKVPAEWQDMAMQFKGPYPGTWDLFEQNIKSWMKRHGKDPDESFSLMMAILNKGLPARPFLYPAFVKNVKELSKNVKRLFKK